MTDYATRITGVKSRNVSRVARRSRSRFAATVADVPKRAARTRKSAAREAPEVTATIARLARRCKELRVEAGLTQQAAAERAGIAIGHLQVVERGATNPTVAILTVLAKAYGVTLETMFRGV